MHIAGEVGHVGRHEESHIALVRSNFHQRFS